MLVLGFACLIEAKIAQANEGLVTVSRHYSSAVRRSTERPTRLSRTQRLAVP